MRRRSKTGWLALGLMGICVNGLARAFAGDAVPGPHASDEAPLRPADREDGDAGLARARFLEAVASGDAERVVRAHAAWAELGSAPLPTAATLAYARALLGRGDGRGRLRAAEELATLLEREPGNVVALVLLARARARAGDARGGEDAQRLLLEAADGGASVLREVAAARELSPLRSNPAFVHALLVRVAPVGSRDLARLRDPFAAPDRRSPCAVQPVSPARPETADLAAVRSATAAALDALDRAAPDERALAAARRARFEALHLSVTGIVLDTSRDAHHRTIVVHDDPQRVGRIYEVGDPVRDGSGAKVPELRVEWIESGRVVFRFEGEDFPKELERP